MDTLSFIKYSGGLFFICLVLPCCSFEHADLSDMGATLLVRLADESYSEEPGTVFLFTDIYLWEEADYSSCFSKVEIFGDKTVTFQLDFSDSDLRYEATSFMVIWTLKGGDKCVVACGGPVSLAAGEHKEIELIPDSPSSTER